MGALNLGNRTVDRILHQLFVTLARYARQHNGANVLALGSALLTPEQALPIVETFLGTPMREARYIRRLLKVRRLEQNPD